MTFLTRAGEVLCRRWQTEIARALGAYPKRAGRWVADGRVPAGRVPQILGPDPRPAACCRWRSSTLASTSCPGRGFSKWPATSAAFTA